jgi:hypothetical protein
MNEAQDAEADRLENQELERLAHIERQKGPRNPTRSQQYFRSAPLTPAQEQAAAAEQDRLERMRQPTPLPPRAAEPDFIETKRAERAKQRLHEKLKRE